MNRDGEPRAVGAETGKLAPGGGGDQPVFEKYLNVLKWIADQPLYVGPTCRGGMTRHLSLLELARRTEAGSK